MITKIENAVLLCIISKAWEIKKDNKSGISYPALIYTNKTVLNCRADEKLFNLFNGQELIKGTAVIEIQETNYNDKKSVQYILREFGATK